MKPTNPANPTPPRLAPGAAVGRRFQLVKASIALLLGLVLAGLGVFTASAGNVPVSAARAGCQCCQSDPAKCAAPVCCAQPAHQVPFAPGSLPVPSQNERPALAASVSSLLTLPLFPAAKIPSHPVASAALAAIPLFQWHCRYVL